ncbi:hypothetical protein DL546_009298 [Coniochaeta pulveracea]|uniref:Uncharacterized protein n=1 Tax=Coniochaeta pulveracea TaxID=177199 RepID=A0A420YNS7_9PEZI|nr:hypothetical protein DL546_009298 [Coniochaeta pulveracea]
MHTSVLSALLLAAGSSALTLKRGDTCQCSFTLSASGDVTGPVGEDSEGEVLEGSKLTAAKFCLNGDTIVDSKGNSCLFTPPTYVLQCDAGGQASTGFSIGCNGELSYNGQTTFYECPNGIDDEVNLYSKPDQGTKCGKVTFTADSCHAQCTTSKTATPTPTPPPASTVSVTTTVTVTNTVSNCPTASPTCPMELPSDYQYPHLIVPVDSSKPSTAAGTSYFGQVSSTISTIFNFDIPQSYSGKTCELWFSLPTQAQLVTSSFTLSGSGAVDFKSLSGVATESTTSSNAPGVASDLGQVTVAAGNAYKVASFSCPAGKAVSYEMSAVGDTALKYFQDYNPCAIGLWVIPN